MSPRAAGLPIVAILMVVGVLGVQVREGGGDFAPLAAADPCAPREVTSQAEGIDNLTERLVLLGLDGAGCELGLTREALTLRLAQPGPRTDEEVEAMREGLLGAVRRLDEEGTLPPISSFVDEALDNVELNGLLEAAIRRIPESLIDRALDTDAVVSRAIESLDLKGILENLDDTQDLNRQLNTAVEQAVKDELVDRLRGLLP